MPSRLYNLAGVSTATTGTGTVTLGSALPGHLTFADAGVANGTEVSYSIKEGLNIEVGRGVYSSTGPTLTRPTILRSTAGGSAINLTGNAEVRIVVLAEDIDQPPGTVFGTSAGAVGVSVNIPNGWQGLDITYNAGGNYIDLQGIHAGSAYRDVRLNPIAADVWLGASGLKALQSGQIRNQNSQEVWDLFKNLHTPTNATNSNAVQPWFPSAGAVTVEASVAYEFKGELYLGTTAASTTHTVAVGFGGTMAHSAIRYNVWGLTQTSETGAGTALSTYTLNVITMTVITGTSGTMIRKSIFIEGTIRINTGGTLIPQFQYSAAPNQTPQVLNGTMFRMRKIGAAGSTNSWGTWA